VTVIEEIQEFAAEMTEFRRDLHAHPELGYHEERTADRVARQLASYGVDVHRGLGRTGVVGTLRRGNSTCSLGLRAELDALPMAELNRFSHRSRFEGRMHACGHDGHTTMLLGAARHLADKGDFDGVVNFIFQPAEEGGAGADAMIKEGLFEQFPCDVVFGMHNAPGLAAGKFSFRSGPMMAGCAFFDITVAGVGGHGAIPETAVDPIVAASHIVSALQTIVSRNIRPFEPAVVTVTQVHAGDAYNVIPAQAVLSGTVRCFTAQIMSAIGERIEQLAASVANGLGATAKTDYRVVYPPLVNHADETHYIANVAAELVGEENVIRDGRQLMASEDFSFMLNARPGAFINIGNGDGDGSCAVHNPNYDFNDSILPLGAALWVKLVEKRLARIAGASGVLP
jgi:amidohydrolase